MFCNLRCNTRCLVSLDTERSIDDSTHCILVYRFLQEKVKEKKIKYVYFNTKRDNDDAVVAVERK